MTINWYGQSCFKISGAGGRLVIFTDPFDKSLGLPPPRSGADIVTVSHNHYDHNNTKAITGEPFVIEGPGEYEIKGVKIIGCDSFHDEKKGAQRGRSTIYLIEMEKIRFCHLGDFGEARLRPKQMEFIGPVDVLALPVGGKYTIDAKAAAQIVKQLEPKIVIPMHYKIEKLKEDLDGVEKFLKEMGENGKAAVDKITFKARDLIGKRMETVVMKP